MPSSFPIVCFGEVLWDILPNGAVPGGAPMNVAYHLHKLQNNPALITRIGNDEQGKALLDIFSAHGICVDYFQVDDAQETGKVYAKPNEQNEVTYDIIQPVAWDFIEWNEDFTELVSNASFFVFGSLAARNRQSRDTLFRLLELARFRVLDINLRAPHFNQQIVEQLMSKAEMLKMNLAELELITGWYAGYDNIEDRIRFIRDKFNIRQIIVTMGGDGAVVHMNDQMIRHNGYKVRVMDTVGSGDAFLAGFLSSIRSNKTPEASLDFASALGAFIATQKGACPVYDVAEVERVKS